MNQDEIRAKGLNNSASPSSSLSLQPPSSPKTPETPPAKRRPRLPLPKRFTALKQPEHIPGLRLPGHIPALRLPGAEADPVPDDEKLFNLHKQIIAKLEDTNCFNESWEKEITFLENLKLHDYLYRHDKACETFSCCLDDPESEFQAFKSLNSTEWKITQSGARESEQSFRFIVVSHRFMKSFLLLINDFYIVYLKTEDAFHIQMPLSRCVRLDCKTIQSDSNYFDKLIGDVLPIQQVYFLARRLVQLVGARWEFDCLARLEKSIEPMLNGHAYSIPRFPSINIDLYPMNFDCLTACKVGILTTNDDCVHSAGIELFGRVVIFRITDNNIAQPDIIAQAKLEDCPEFTDWCKFAIGGRNHRTDNEISSTSISHSHENNFQQQLKIIGIKPANIKLSLFQDPVTSSERAIYNLAFLPQNRTFREIMSKQYNKREAEHLLADLMKLGYGKQLSEWMVCCVINEKKDWGVTSVAEAQHLLLARWEDMTHRNNRPLEPFPVHSPWERYFPSRKPLLVLDAGKLYIARSKRKINWNLSGGFKGFVAVGGMVQKRDLFEQGAVENILDAAERVSGVDELNFHTLPSTRGKLPTRSGMEHILGVLTFICLLLNGRVTPHGPFKGSVLNHTQTGQNIDFNIPLPSGVVSSTFARCNADEKHLMLVDQEWDANRNYTYPVVLGVEEEDHELISEVSKASWGHDTVSRKRLESRTDYFRLVRHKLGL